MRTAASASTRSAQASEAQASERTVVHVVLADGGRGWAQEAKALVKQWARAFAAMGLTVDVELASAKKAVVSVAHVDELKLAVAWLARQPLVHWVQEDILWPTTTYAHANRTDCWATDAAERCTDGVCKEEHRRYMQRSASHEII